jgi:hypothetical protein
MQHPNETLAKICTKHLKTLETYTCNMHAYATSRSIFATTKQNTCNICLEQIKHLKHTLKTYVYSGASACCLAITTCAISQSTFATSIYKTYNIPQKHIKHLKHAHIATCAFSVTYCLNEWSLVDMELETAEWRGGH